MQMRGATSLSVARNIHKQFQPFKGTWGGVVSALEPKRPGNEENVKGTSTVADEKASEPIVAFSRPPPFTPFLGSVVVLSMFDSWSRRDSSDA